MIRQFLSGSSFIKLGAWLCMIAWWIWLYGLYSSPAMWSGASRVYRGVVAWHHYFVNNPISLFLNFGVFFLVVGGIKYIYWDHWDDYKPYPDP